MGLSVISKMSGATAPTAALPGLATAVSAAADTPASAFATLLSGELQALLAGDSTKGTLALDEKATKAERPDTPPSEGAIDPALIASLIGHAGVPPEPARQASPILDAPNDAAAAGIARANQAIAEGGSSLKPADTPDQKRTATSTELPAPTQLKPGEAKAEPAVDEPKNDKFASLTEKAATPSRPEHAEARHAAAPPSTVASTTDKPPPLAAPVAAPLQAPGSTQRNEAANIAVEANAAAPNANALAHMSAVAAAKQTTESAPGNSQRPHIDAPVHDAAWPQQLGDKVVWLARSDVQSAQISINPPQLGPLQITVNLSGDQASVVFASPHPEVRQAIESAMPQLKDMLSAAGISLGQSNVGANMGQQNPDNPFQAANGTRSAGENAILPANDNTAASGAPPALHRGRGLVDLFA